MTRLQQFLSNIVRFWQGIKTTDGKFVGTAIRDWVTDAAINLVAGVLRRIELDYTPLLKKTIEQVEKTGDLPPEIAPIVQEIKSPSKQIGAMLGNAAAGGITGGLISSTIGPFLKLFEYRRNREAKQARWDIQTGLALMYRKPDEREGVRNDWLDQGWDKHRITVLEAIAATRIKEDLLVELRRRIGKTESDYVKRMRDLGYEEKEAEDYYTASLQYPGVSDLVRMAVREAFSPEIAEKFGQYQDLPPKFLEYAKQIGLPDDFAKAFWAAHWDLPSPNMGFEMLHRGIINQEDLKLLLRALDIMPYWRDRMIQLSYAPFTRVDVRRMHKLGILARDQVVKAYQDIGYDPEKAEQMTKFTEQLNAGAATDAEKELSKAEILKAYKERLVTQEEAEESLRELGYDDASIWLLLTMSQEQATLKTRDLTLSQVKDLYQKGLRTKQECSAFLAAFGYDANEITALYDLWDWESPQADRLPSRTDFDNFAAAGIITLQQWSDGYTALGYDMRYQEWYFAYLVEKGKLS